MGFAANGLGLGLAKGGFLAASAAPSRHELVPRGQDTHPGPPTDGNQLNRADTRPAQFGWAHARSRLDACAAHLKRVPHRPNVRTRGRGPSAASVRGPVQPSVRVPTATNGKVSPYYHAVIRPITLASVIPEADDDHGQLLTGHHISDT